MYAESMGAGYDENWSRRLTATAMHVDTTCGLDRLMNRALVSVGAEIGTFEGADDGTDVGTKEK